MVTTIDRPDGNTAEINSAYLSTCLKERMTMIRTLFALTLLLFGGVAYGQFDGGSAYPNNFGGFDTFGNSAQPSYSTRSDGIGGFNTYGNTGQLQSTTRQDGIGGFNTYSNPGRLQSTTRPDGAGGFNTYSSPGRLQSTTRPDGLGGFNSFNQFGQPTHSVKPQGNGSYQLRPMAPATQPVNPPTKSWWSLW